MILLVLVLMQTAARAVCRSAFRLHPRARLRFRPRPLHRLRGDARRRLARADVLFVGEQHDDPNTHRLELAILEGLTRRRGDMALALEMFERDAQELLSSYAEGRIGEDAVPVGFPPVAALRDRLPPSRGVRQGATAGRSSRRNVPRRLASAVAKGGLDALTSDDDRALYAAERRVSRGRLLRPVCETACRSIRCPAPRS